MGSIGSSNPMYLGNLNYNDTKDWIKSNSNLDEWLDYVLDNEYDEDINKYSGEAYSSINYFLRTGKFDPYNAYYTEDTMMSNIKNISDAISNFSLNKPISVHRISTSEILGSDNMTYEQIQSMVGKTVTEKGFMSTTTLKQLHGEQTVFGSVSYTIEVPKGKGIGAYIAPYSENSIEREFLIKNNSKYRITKVEKDKNGKPVVYMKYVK